jgi:putative alpha-1,2-mannosidase
LNGRDFDQTVVSHQTIVAGGRLDFQMDAMPNYRWGVSPQSRPGSPLQHLLENN